MKAYVRKPCKRCGQPKDGDKYQTGHQWYCSACAVEVRKDYWRKHVKYWCTQCMNPWFCAACKANKYARIKLAAANRKHKPDSTYFRPVNAERWWQARSHSMVSAAVKKGLLPNLKTGEYACSDCGAVAMEYDHRDYGRPFDVDPVCRSCNKQRGTAIWPVAERFQFKKIA